MANSPVEMDAQIVQSNARGIILMILSMSTFAIADTLIRLASLGIGVGAGGQEVGAQGGGASAGQVVIFMSLFGVPMFGALLRRSGERITRDVLLDRTVLARTASDMFSATCFITALTLMPVGNASAILQIQPIAVTVGAVVFLGEVVGWRRWSAIAVGFIGVMVIIRPGLEGFTGASIWVVLAVIGLAARDLLTRVVKARHSTFMMAFLVSLALLPTGLAVHWFGDQPFAWDAPTLLILSLGSIVAMGAYYCITQSVRVAEISAVAPYRYTRLIAAFVAAYFILGERPDALTLVGAALIVLGGLMVLRRERLRQ